MKFTNADIKKLKEKGVDPSVILDLLLEEEETPGAAPETPEEKPEDKKPAAPEEKKPETPKDPDPITPEHIRQATEVQDQILKAIEKLTGAVQTSNLLNAGSTGPDVDTTEAVLASIINPKGGK